LPGVIARGKEEKIERPQAGMLFYNDEGSENGGLIFSCHENDKGEVVDSGGRLSFDRYGHKQMVHSPGGDDSTDKFAGLIVSDSNRRIWAGRLAPSSSVLLTNESNERTCRATAVCVTVDDVGVLARQHEISQTLNAS
jgi:hypothetical protein